MYCLIFGQYLHVNHKKKRNERSILIYPLTMLFLLSTTNFILNLSQTFWIVVSNMWNTSVQILNWFCFTLPTCSCVLGATKTSYRKLTSYWLRYMDFLTSFLSQFWYASSIYSRSLFLIEWYIDIPLLGTVESQSITSSCPNNYGINVVRWVITFINWWYHHLLLHSPAWSNPYFVKWKALSWLSL